MRILGLVALFLATLASASFQSSAPAASSQGRIAGLVRYLGDPPKITLVDFSACSNCASENAGQPVARDDLTVNPNGTLRNAVVFLRGTSPALANRRFPDPGEVVPLQIRGGMFRPHVTALRTGQTLAIHNVSTCGFNVKGSSQSNMSFNVMQPRRGAVVPITFDREEVAIRIEDNVHPWTSGWIAVLSHPHFAVTGEEGSFELGDLAPGDYELAVWHETLGEQSQTLSLAAGETKRFEFSFRRGPGR
ncbi:MAG TPA: carboxypeptidase regulatory-like domain-containing protein [Planctomycetota bacterium]|jgi:hypothetical protein|nr:carboxypeptidase regulatory-like domain-containing protein [Planctomycetota bacterium]